MQKQLGASNTLVGVPLEAGPCQVTVTVTDAAEQVGETAVLLEIHETPQLLTDSLPGACVSEEYAATLTAAGGDEAAYQFHAIADGTAEWSTADGRLSGAVDSMIPITFDVWVDDGRCESPHASLTLEVQIEGEGACPLITPAELPAPCSGQPYEVALESTAPGAWEGVEMPEGLTLEQAREATTATLSGTAAWPAGEKQPISVRLTTDEGRSFVRSIPVTPRDKCWLGYISRQDGPWQFQLYDPVFRKRHSFQANVDAPVTTFRFAPNGKFVAYQSQATSGQFQLTLLAVGSLEEQVLSFSGSVTEYSWSPNSRFLAVVTTSEGGATSLAGVDVSAVRATGLGAAGSVLQDVEYIAPAAASVISEITWFGENGVAYQAPDASGFRRIIEHTYIAAGSFEPRFGIETIIYFPPVRLHGFPSGLVAADIIQSNFLVPGTNGFGEWFGRAVKEYAYSPSGRHVARTSSGTLEVYHPNTLEGSRAHAVSVEGENCEVLLSWARHDELVACVTNADGGGELRIFDVPESSAMLRMSTVEGDYVYTEAGSSGRRRSFSPRGAYFAFATDDWLYVADLVKARALRRYQPRSFETAPADARHIDFAFSADERFLIQHRGKDVTLHDLSKTDEGRFVLVKQQGDEVEIEPGCSEEYAGIEQKWCGSGEPSRHVLWSSEGHFVTLLGKSGALRVFEALDDRVATHIVNPDCGAGCVKQFAYQP